MASRKKATNSAKDRARGLRKEVYRASIAEAAEQLFGQHGIDGTKMEEISAESGLAVATVYSAFKQGKSEIVREIHATRLGELVRDVETIAAEEGPSDERLRRALRTAVEFFIDHENYLRMQLREGHAWFSMDAVASRISWGGKSWKAGVGALLQIVEDGVAEGVFATDNTRRSGKAVLMLQQLHLADWLEAGGQESPETVFEMYWADAALLLGRTRT